MAKIMDCNLEVNEFELQSRYYVLFGKFMNFLIQLWVK